MLSCYPCKTAPFQIETEEEWMGKQERGGVGGIGKEEGEETVVGLLNK